MSVAPPSSPPSSPPSPAAARGRGWRGYRWLLLRRLCQATVLLAFLAGPWFGLWWVKGNLTSSRTLDVLPLSDPFVVLQVLASGHWPYADALIGAAIVCGFYMLVGGRVFCSWVCPVNVVTDSAGWLRQRLGIRTGGVSASTRYYLLGGILLAAALSGSLAWELVNPVALLHRGLLFGIGFGWLLVLAVFIYDLTIATRGWCGHVCPQGAFYALLGRTAMLRISAARREHCNDCMDCFKVCPEPQVIRPALKAAPDRSPLILAPECTNCARCIDVCDENVFKFAARLRRREE